MREAAGSSPAVSTKLYVPLKSPVEKRLGFFVLLYCDLSILRPPYKYPRVIEFVTELPKTISGKIRRVELRERDKGK
jgi:acyl-coenzyme A synthetase/AMP-(fatty) acid ligase